MAAWSHLLSEARPVFELLTNPNLDSNLNPIKLQIFLPSESQSLIFKPLKTLKFDFSLQYDLSIFYYSIFEWYHSILIIHLIVNFGHNYLFHL